LAKNLGISIKLARFYKEGLRLRKMDPECYFKLGTNNENISKCSVYGQEIISSDIEISENTHNLISLRIASIKNPSNEISCIEDSLDELNFFQIKIFNFKSGNVLFVNSPDSDDLNCI
jgi:hypothetical protein